MNSDVSRMQESWLSLLLRKEKIWLIDSQNLTRWLAMPYEIDSQLSQLSQTSTLEDRKRLEELISYFRFAGVASYGSKRIN